MTKLRLLLALIIAVFLDIVDYIAFGWLPIAGDLLDIVGLIISLALIGKYALLSLFELIPFIGDLLPMFTLSVAWAKIEERKCREAVV